ncbi:alpha/beta hydrolase family protein [Streptomyces venezuelae ATCC 10712]
MGATARTSTCGPTASLRPWSAAGTPSSTTGRARADALRGGSRDEYPLGDRRDPLVDWLIARDDVDPRRIALSGLSLGGNLAPRAAAFETRLAAVIASPGCVAPWNAFPAEIRKILTPSKEETNQIWNKEVVPELPPADRFTLSKRFEPYDAAVMRAARQKKMFTDFYTPARVLVDLDITKVAPGIKVPALVVNFEDDQFFPGQARQLYDLIGGQKDLIDMTSAQGAQLHCSPMAPQYYNEVVFDWLADTVK